MTTRHATLVVTTCSASKRSIPSICASALRRGTQAPVAREWIEAICGGAPTATAQNLYAGRGFRLAVAAAAAIPADLAVVSAGLGYVRARTRVPAYDLTIQPDATESVLRRVRGPFDPVQWWRTVSRGPFASSLGEDIRSRRLVLLCLSRAYAHMIEEELALLARRKHDNLRFFGLSISQALPPGLRQAVMPYDERFEGVGPKGTRLDFSQRALVHFVTAILPVTGGSLSDHRSAVMRSLRGRRRPVERKTLRATDAQIVELITHSVSTVGFSKARVLRHIRRTMRVSCEQARFSRLYDCARLNLEDA